MPFDAQSADLGSVSPTALLSIPVEVAPATNAGSDKSSPTFSEARAYEFWFALITEIAAAAFLDLERRTMQSLRQRGGGPRFVRISSRCIKYRRADLRTWSEARLVSSAAEATPEI